MTDIVASATAQEQQQAERRTMWLERMREKKKQLDEQRQLQQQQQQHASAGDPPLKRRVQATDAVTATEQSDRAARQQEAENAAELIETARREREALQRRIVRTKTRAHNVYYNPVQIKQRYGRANALAEFIRDKTAPGGGGKIAASSARASSASSTSTTTGSSAGLHEIATGEASLRIDEIVASQENEAAERQQAAARVMLADSEQRYTESGARPSLSIDQFVTRIAQAGGAGAVDTIDEDLFSKPFQVAGLSTTVPNPDWEQMQIDRQALIARRKELSDERRSLTSGRKWIAIDINARTSYEEVRRQELRNRLREYEPLESIELLKPDSQVRAINLRWRTRMGDVLATEHARYLDVTRAYLLRTSAALAQPGTVEGLADLYMQHVVNPVFDRHLRQLRSSTYEDQPLTREILEQYFYQFLNELFATPLLFLRDPPLAASEYPQADKPSEYERVLEQRARQLRRLIGLAPIQKLNAAGGDAEKDDEVGDEPVPVELHATDADPSGADFTTPQGQEAAQVAEYLRQALNIHASPLYIDWLRLWMVGARRQVEETAATVDTKTAALDRERLDVIERLVRNMVRDREEVQRKRNEASGRVVPRYHPISEAEIVETYSTLLRNEVALSRAEALLRQREEWSRAIVDYLNGTTDILPPLELRVRPRLDFATLVTNASFEAQRQAVQLFAGDNDAVTRAVELVDRRTAELRNETLYYAPRIADYRYYEHAPLDAPSNTSADAVDNAWSPYNLAYPLSTEQTALQLERLRINVLSRAEQFDADAIHRRANELRSVLTYDYAERLVLRSIAQINYYLERVMVPERQIAFALDMDVASTQPVQLAATLELRPELEMALRQPRATRDPRVDALAEQLRASPHTVRWFFVPSYGPNAGIEELAFTETLPAGRQTSLLLLNPTGRIVRVEPSGEVVMLENRETSIELQRATNEAVGGIYRVEFEPLATPGFVVPSLFKAVIRVVARCKRDNVTYEVGDARPHGECQWREYAHDETMQNLIDEWRVLVTRGTAAYESLVRRRREEQQLRLVTGADYELFLPPWGEETEQALLRTFRATQSDDCFEERFMYLSIVRRIVDRLGGQIRRDMRAKSALIQERINDTDPTLRPQLTALLNGFRQLSSTSSNNMALFTILVSGARATEPLIRAAALNAIAKSALGSWTEPERELQLLELDAGTIDRVIAYYAFSVGGIVPAGPTVVVPPPYEPMSPLSSLPPELENTYMPTRGVAPPSMPVEALKPLLAGYAGSVESVPLATMLNAMYLPTVWPNLTWREKRFINTMLARFTRFANDYRDAERRRLYYRGLLNDNKGLDHVPALLSVDIARKTQFNNPPAPTPIFNEIELEIDERLGSLTPHAVKHATAWYTAQRYRDPVYSRSEPLAIYENATVTGDTLRGREQFMETFLLDTDLCAEYQEKIRDLVGAGLLVPNANAACHVVSIRMNPYVPSGWKVAQLQTQSNYVCDTDTAYGRFNTAAPVAVIKQRRADWLGTHSYTTVQPDFYQVVVDPLRGAYVLVRGSAPLNKGYDFAGIHKAIVDTTRHYTRIAQGAELALPPGPMLDSALVRLETRLQRLELAYNFLAFVAPPLGNSVFFPAEALLLLIDDQGSDEWLKRLRGALY